MPKKKTSRYKSEPNDPLDLINHIDEQCREANEALGLLVMTSRGIGSDDNFGANEGQAYTVAEGMVTLLEAIQERVKSVNTAANQMWDCIKGGAQ